MLPSRLRAFAAALLTVAATAQEPSTPTPPPVPTPAPAPLPVPAPKPTPAPLPPPVADLPTEPTPPAPPQPASTPRSKARRTFSPVVGGDTAPAAPAAPLTPLTPLAPSAPDVSSTGGGMGGGVGASAEGAAPAAPTLAPENASNRIAATSPRSAQNRSATVSLQDEKVMVAARKLAALLDRARLESELVEATGLPRKTIGGVVRTLVRPRVSGDRGTTLTLTVPESALVVSIRSDVRIDVRKLDEAAVERTIRMTEAAVNNAADALPEEARPAFRAWWEAKHAAMTALAGTLKDAVAAAPRATAVTEEPRVARTPRRLPAPPLRTGAAAAPETADEPAEVDGVSTVELDAFGRFPSDAFAPHAFVDDLARARVEAALGEDRVLRLGRITGDHTVNLFTRVRSAEDEALRAELTAEIVRLATEGKSKEAADVAQRLAALEPALRYRLVGPEGIALTRSADGTLRAAEPAEADAFAGATTDSRPTSEEYRRAVRDAIKVDVDATRRAADALRADAERQARDAQAFSETVRARDAAAAAEQQAARDELRRFREEQIRELRTEIDALRKEIDALRKAKEGGKEGGGR